MQSPHRTLRRRTLTSCAVLIAGLGVVPTVASAASNGQVNARWGTQFGSALDDEALDAAFGPDGTLYVAAVTDEGGDPCASHGVLAAYDPAGDQMWASDQENCSRYTAVAVDGRGDVIAGGSDLDGEGLGFVERRRADGQLRWKIYDDLGLPVDGRAEPAAIVATERGAFYVAWTAVTSSGVSTIVQRVGKHGREVWVQRIDQGSLNMALDLQLDPRGRPVVVGVTRNSLGSGQRPRGNDAFIRVLGTGGDAKWTRLYGTPGDDVAVGVGIDQQSGRLYVAGGTALDAPRDMWIIAVEGAGKRRGSVRWTRTDSPTGDGQFQLAGIGVLADGSIVAVGSSPDRVPASPTEPAGGSDLFAIRVWKNGSVMSSNMFGSPADEVAHGGAVDPANDRFVVVGSTGGAAFGESAGADDVAVVLAEP